MKCCEYGPRAQSFCLLCTNFCNKLELLSLASLSSLVYCLYVWLELSQVNYYSVAPLYDRLLAIFTNIRLYWEGLLPKFVKYIQTKFYDIEPNWFQTFLH
jgi:hypothetical protein